MGCLHAFTFVALSAFNSRITVSSLSYGIKSQRLGLHGTHCWSKKDRWLYGILAGICWWLACVDHSRHVIRIHTAVVVGLLAQALLHSIVSWLPCVCLVYKFWDVALGDISCISSLLKKSSIAWLWFLSCVSQRLEKKIYVKLLKL